MCLLVLRVCVWGANLRGVCVMQTPANKPTSVITIIRFKDYAAIKALFGEADIPEAGYTVRIERT